MWVLQNEKNCRIFEDKAKELHNLIADIQKALYGFSKGKALFRGSNVHDFIVE